jgi:hypothetical protein
MAQHVRMHLEGHPGLNADPLDHLLQAGHGEGRWVRCSRGRSSLLGRRVGVTVRFTVAGATNLRRVFAISFKPPGSYTIRILSRIRTVVNDDTVAALMSALGQKRTCAVH